MRASVIAMGVLYMLIFPQLAVAQNEGVSVSTIREQIDRIEEAISTTLSTIGGVAGIEQWRVRQQTHILLRIETLEPITEAVRPRAIFFSQAEGDKDFWDAFGAHLELSLMRAALVIFGSIIIFYTVLIIFLLVLINGTFKRIR